jgi:hypothetical protein
MSCKICKYFQFNQNDMMGACKLYPTVVNKLPQDWCGQEIPKEYEPANWEKVDSITITVAPETTYDIHTDEVKPKRGRKNAGTKE